jgi:hypothetical protein
LERFRDKRAQRRKEPLKNQVNAADDHDQAVELLRRLQEAD